MADADFGCAQSVPAERPQLTPRRDGSAATCGIAVMAKASAPGRTKTRLVPPLSYRRSRGAQYRLPAGRRRQSACAPANMPASPAMPPSRPTGSRGFFSPHSAAGDRLDRRLAAGFRRLPRFTPSSKFSPAGMARPWCSIPTARRCRPRCWSKPRKCWRGRASAPCSALRATAAIICSDLNPRIAACSTTSPGAPSASPRRRSTRAREIELDVHMLPVWYDVDDIEGLRRLSGEVSRRARAREPARSRASRITRRRPRP